MARALKLSLRCPPHAAVPGRLQAAERYLRASGLRYTIVRPGGLSDKPPEEVCKLLRGPVVYEWCCVGTPQ
jgi:uncharacterized protein YbjT (DUF2867 family)